MLNSFCSVITSEEVEGTVTVVCGAPAAHEVRVPYLMGQTVLVALCRKHRAAHNQHFAELRNLGRSKGGAR